MHDNWTANTAIYTYVYIYIHICTYIYIYVWLGSDFPDFFFCVQAPISTQDNWTANTAMWILARRRACGCTGCRRRIWRGRGRRCRRLSLKCRYCVECQKKPTAVSKETYNSVKWKLHTHTRADYHWSAGIVFWLLWLLWLLCWDCLVFEKDV